MSSGLAAPIPQIPGPFHDFLDPDSYPARQVETCLARLQSVQAVLKGFAFDMSKNNTSTTGVQDPRATHTWVYPTKVTSDVKKEAWEDCIYLAATVPATSHLADVGALEAVTQAIVKLRTALGLTG